ncbi:MAG TPA: EAL domain-containing protein [Vitreimonas sp.]|uniref:putative bifunctional diguanylate cyclase/phosphodiesterase n=1 Tax=Vitreimonas sp. TaxID=3069702 RepID=UPI002D726ACC|nr:EAL domain-containing protein [Vitreimonas sp.]HYD88234.1 EAL domain-containing protein [Vitreimonas sp.]
MSSAQGEDGASASARLGRILLVDDQAQNRDMLGRRLERRGYDVVLRESAVGIEDAIEADKIELVLLDWMMPERSGADALAGIRARFDAEHVPVIVVTALDDGDIVSKALEGGANDYITKPIDLRVLTARVKAQLDRRQAVLELDAIRDNLERTVQERTQDLIKTNETLSAEISEREAAEARAQTLARHDPLTGLANRRHFLEELERRLSLVGEEASAFALMFIDLDRFKPINDVHGHAIGDQLLQVIATRLKGCIRDDSFAARLGGDEFAILLEDPGGRDGVASASRRILHELAAPILVNGLKLTVGASIGVALCPEDGRDAADLLQRGDAAMLRAKEERGAFKFFDSSIDEELKSKAALETELRTAIPNGDIVPYFQPVVRLDTGELAGFEVLARWPHRDRGMISPVSFIPVAEDAGLVDAMFWALLAQACRKALDAPGEFVLAVNISPSQVRDQWFPEKVLRTLRETGFPAQRLEIEVTESAMIGDVARAKSALLSLKNQGVQIALDDFGTGYSSLFLLRELPIDKLKIDQSFVARILTDRENATIVGALVGLGKALGLKVTAEGVEDEATAEALRAMGCEFAQGFLYGAAAIMPEYMTPAMAAAARLQAAAR